MKPHRLVQLITVTAFLAVLTSQSPAQTSAVGAKAKSDLSPEQKVATLIRKLGDNDWRTREFATKSLQQLGDPIAPYLEAARAEFSDPEICVRAEAILAALNVRLLTAITVEANNLNVSTIGDLLDKLAALTQRANPRRGGVSFELMNQRYRSVGVNGTPIGRCSLANILDRTLKAAGLEYQIRHDKVIIFEQSQGREEGCVLKCGG